MSESGDGRSLGSRLRRLRGQSDPGPVEPAGASEPIAPTGRQPSFAERVQRLMVGPTVVRARQPDPVALRDALGAEEMAPGVLLIERRLDGRQRHGHGPLPDPDSIALAALADGLPGWDGATASGGPLCCLDTETSGLAGGTGTWAFMTGLLTAEPDGWRLRQFLLTRLDAEPDYLAAVRAALAGVGVLVSYNGRAFDAPLLTTRFRLAGQPDPLAGLTHLDLLAPVRRAFGRVWPDCRLASAESRLLGVVRQDDLPGAAAPAAWLGWMRQGGIGPLAAVARHNRWDLLSLAGLLPVLARAFSEPAALGADPRAVAAHQARLGRTGQAIRILESDPRALGREGLLELARLQRRLGHLAAACDIWQRLAAAGDPDARLALAKYHEHQTRDVARALDLAAGLPDGSERERRCARLRAKLTRRARSD